MPALTALLRGLLIVSGLALAGCAAQQTRDDSQ